MDVPAWKLVNNCFVIELYSLGSVKISRRMMNKDRNFFYNKKESKRSLILLMEKALRDQLISRGCP